MACCARTAAALSPLPLRLSLALHLLLEAPAPAHGSRLLLLLSQPFEARLGVVEALLRNFSSFETLTFVDFLPYIWDSLGVQYARPRSPLEGRPPLLCPQPPVATADRACPVACLRRYTSKLLSLLHPSDRSRLAKQLAADEAAARQAEAGESAALKVETEASKRQSLSADPSQLLPSELPGWLPYSPCAPPPEANEPTRGATSSAPPAPSAAASYELPHFLRIGSECLERLVCISARRRSSGLLDGLAEPAEPDLPRVVFNELLRLNIPPPKPGLQSAQCAKESLWTFLTAARSYSRSHPRAKLLARLCGVIKHEYHPQRVTLFLRVIASLFGGEPSFEGELWLPMARADDPTATGWRPPDLPMLVNALEAELGGPSRVEALLEKLRAITDREPRPAQLVAARHKDGGSLATRVVSGDEALLLLIDAYDAARLKTATGLATLHEHLEVTRVSGGLDPHTFASLLGGFDPTIDQQAALAIFVECELRAHEERQRADGPSASSKEGTTIPRAIFVRVCEEHGVRGKGE